MTELDDDDIREAADLWGVSFERAEAYLEAQADRADEREELKELAEAEEEERDERLDDEFGELADLWGVEPEEVESLYEAIGGDAERLGSEGLTQAELRDYIDDLYDALVGEGWELDVSDLWDMYYGYTPSGGG